jgi:hypothetical protein
MEGRVYHGEEKMRPRAKFKVKLTEVMEERTRMARLAALFAAGCCGSARNGFHL